MSEYLSADDARAIARRHMEDMGVSIDVEYPVLVERFRVWRSTLKYRGKVAGEIVLDASTGEIDHGRTTKPDLIFKRIAKADDAEKEMRENRRKKRMPHLSDLPNTVGLGDSEELLSGLPDESVDLVFTSPPYYNARPEYQEYIDYDDYLEKMRSIFKESGRVLHEGRFFAINSSMTLIRRATAQESSTRLAVPFDLHRIMVDEGFEFIDDIIWVKPEGAGWVSGRGRNFALNRKPLSYKPVPVTEYIMVYRKKSEYLLGWNISGHPDQDAVNRSKITGDYDKTNIWKIQPSFSKDHPAIFPQALAERIIRYYSFENDVVLDPFGGIGTTAMAAIALKRRFVMLEQDPDYMKIFQKRLAESDVDMEKIRRINMPDWQENYQLRLM